MIVFFSIGFYNVESRVIICFFLIERSHFSNLFFAFTFAYFFRCMVLHSLQHKIAFVCSRTEWSTNTGLYKTMFNRTIESVASGFSHLCSQKERKGKENYNQSQLICQWESSCTAQPQANTKYVKTLSNIDGEI